MAQLHADANVGVTCCDRMNDMQDKRLRLRKLERPRAPLLSCPAAESSDAKPSAQHANAETFAKRSLNAQHDVGWGGGGGGNLPGVNINFDELDVGKLGSLFLEERPNHAARPAPGGGEIHDHL